MNDRMQKVRQVVGSEAPRDLSPSQRDRFINDEIRQYQKPELIRQAIKNVKNNAEAQKAKRLRESQDIKSPSKIKKNLKTQKKVRAQSANLAAKRAATQALGKNVEEERVNKVLTDLNVSYKQLGALPKAGTIPAQRQNQLDQLEQELTNALQQNQQLTVNYKQNVQENDHAFSLHQQARQQE